MRSYVDFAIGLSLVLFAIVIASSARISRPIGYILGLTGLLYFVGGYGYGTGYTSLSDYFTPNGVYYAVLILAWSIWLLIVAWRMKESVQATAA